MLTILTNVIITSIAMTTILAEKDYRLCQHHWKDNGDFYNALTDTVQPIHIRKNSKQTDLLVSQANGQLSIVSSMSTGLFNTDVPRRISQGDFCSATNDKIYIADMNGDHYDDLLCRKADGSFTVRYYHINRFSPEEPFAQEFQCGAIADIDILVGDFDGNHASDIICYDKDGASLAYSPVYFSQTKCQSRYHSAYDHHGEYHGRSHHVDGYSRDSSHSVCAKGLPMVAALPNGVFSSCDMSWSGLEFFVLDANGDGKDDVGCKWILGVYAYLSHGSRNGLLFSTQAISSTGGGCPTTFNKTPPADIDGDGDDDVLCLTINVGTYSPPGNVFFSMGTYEQLFLNSVNCETLPAGSNFCEQTNLPDVIPTYYVGDYNGDGKDDVMCRFEDAITDPANHVMRTHIVFAEYLI